MRSFWTFIVLVVTFSHFCLAANNCLSFDQICPLGEGHFAQVGDETPFILLKANTKHFFYLNVPGGTQDAKNFKLYPTLGRPMMKASNNGKNPDTNPSHSTKVSNMEQDIVFPKAEVTGGQKLYVVVIAGAEDARYSLVGETLGEPIPLTSGNPLADHLNEGKWKYYSFTVDESAQHKEITIQVSTEDGDPDVYTSLTEKFPTSSPDKHDKMSTKVEGDAITYHHSEIVSKMTIYIGVTAMLFDSDFEIVIVEDLKEFILPDIPVDFLLENNGDRYYRFDLAEKRSLRINSDLQHGVAHVYAVANKVGEKNFPSVKVADWKSEPMTGGGQIDISKDDPKFPPVGGNLEILVHCVDACLGSIHVTYSMDATTLDDGEVLDIVQPANDYTYFKFTHADHKKDLWLTVVPYFGNTAVYVDCKLDPANHYPSEQPNHFRWKSESENTNSIHLSQNTMGLCDGDFYVAVRSGPEEVWYGITFVQGQEAIALNDGEPFVNFADLKSKQLYVFNPVATIETELSFELLDGEAKLLGKAGAHPTDLDNDFYIPPFGERTITIQKTDKPIYLLVENASATTTCRYELVCYASNPISLIEGQPIIENVSNGKYQYFTFQLLTDKTDLSFSLDSLYGDADIYVSTVDTHPTMAGYLKHHSDVPLIYWASQEAVMEFDEIKITKASKGTYYIGITGNGKKCEEPGKGCDAEFRLRVDSGATPIPNAFVGQAYGTKLIKGEPKYMQLHIFDDWPLTFNLYSEYGSGSYTLKKCDNDDCSAAIQKKTPDWTSKGDVLIGDQVVLSSADLKGVTGLLVTMVSDDSFEGTFGIFTPEVPFTLPVDLTLGYPIAANSHQYFRAEIPGDSGNMVRINTLPFNGCFHAYANYGESETAARPGPTTHAPVDWGCAEGMMDIKVPSGTKVIYFGLFNSDKHDVDVGVSVELLGQNHITLTNGLTYIDHLDVNEGRHYTVEISQRSAQSDFELAFTDFDGENGVFDIYVSLNKVPTAGDAHYKHIHNGTVDRLFLLHSDNVWKNECSDNGCTMNIYIVAQQETFFEALASGIANHIALRDGAPMIEWATKTDSRFFSFEVSDVSKPVTIEVEPFAGDPDVCVSTTDESPHTPNCLYLANHKGEMKTELITFTPKPFTAGQRKRIYYIGVELNPKSGAPTAEFQIVARQQGDTQIVIDGEPFESQVSQGKWDYVKLNVFNIDPHPVRIKLTSHCGGHVMAYVSSGKPAPKPHMQGGDVVDYYWSMDSHGFLPRVDISNNHVHYVSNGEYMIGVYGTECDDFCDYSLDVTVKAPQHLRPGIPHAITQFSDETLTFRVDITDPLVDIHIAMHLINQGSFLATISENVDGKDSIAVLTEDLTAVTIASSQRKTKPTPGQPAYLFVKVQPQTDLQYNIVYEISDDYQTPQMFALGELVEGEVGKGHVSYYRVYFSADAVKEKLIIQFHQSLGQTVVYMHKMGNDPKPPSGDHETRVGWIWGESMSHTFLFTPGQDDFTQGYMDIAVHGFEDSKYEITAYQSEFIEIRDGKLVFGETPIDSPARYFFVPMKAKSPVSFSLTVSEGLMNMFVGLTDKTGPAHHDWSQMGEGVLKPEVGACQSTECIYYIYLECIHSEGDTCQFVLFGEENNDTIELYPGESIEDVVEAKKYKHYILNTGTTDQHLELFASLESGSITVMMGTDTKNFPTIDNPNSYKWISKSDNFFNEITLAAPLPGTEFAISVYGEVDTVYFIYAALTDTLILLPDGRMEEGAVSLGNTVHYKFHINHAEDVIFNIGDIVGEVEMYATFFHNKDGTPPPKPGCKLDKNNKKVCSDYQFKILPVGSVNVGTLTIDHSNPCAHAVEGTNCNPKDFQTGYMYIGIYGAIDGDNKYNVMGQNVNQFVELNQGKTYVANTFRSVICRNRDEKSMSCQGTNLESRQVSYFRTMIPQSYQTEAYLEFALVRPCMSGGGAVCPPMEIWVTSCSASGDCVANSRYPSKYSPNSEHSLWKEHQSRTEVYLSRDSPAFCDPSKAACMYFVSVMSEDDTKTTYPFEITASYKGTVEVIPGPYREEDLVLLNEHRITNDYVNYFLNEPSDQPLLVDMERCYGNPRLYVCDDHCDVHKSVSDVNYSYYTDKDSTCKLKHGKADCDNNKPGHYSIKVKKQNADMDYRMKVLSPKGTEASFRLNVASTERAYWLMPDDSDIELKKITPTSVTIKFDDVFLINADHHDEDVEDSEVQYYAYVWDTNDQTVNHEVASSCGLQHMEYDPKVHMTAVPIPIRERKHALIELGTDLQNKDLGINIVAIYIGTKGTSQEIAYKPKYFTPSGIKGNNSHWMVLFLMLVVFPAAVFSVLGIYWLKQRNSLKNDYGMEIRDLETAGMEIQQRSSNNDYLPLSEKDAGLV